MKEKIKRDGVVERMENIELPVLRNNLAEHHLHFFPLLSYVTVGNVDPTGAAWATILTGTPGFVRPSGKSTLRIQTDVGRFDPAATSLIKGSAIGLLGIDLTSLGQSRLAGKVRKIGKEFIDIDIDQRYKTNFRYLHLQDFFFERDSDIACRASDEVASDLGDDARALILRANTVFIASFAEMARGSHRVDVSNRTGERGFVRIENAGVVIIPGFSGGLYCQSLGNILANPRCGLTFPDFTTGDVLQLSGDASVAFDSTGSARFEEADLLIRFVPETIIFRKGALPVRRKLEIADSSRRLHGRNKLSGIGYDSRWHKLRVEGMVDESSTIRSLYLRPLHGGKAFSWRAAQHLPVRVILPATQKVELRCYTLCCSSADETLRVSVKRQGPVSRYLHSLKEGDVIEAAAPFGGLSIDTHSSRLAVFLACGIGIAPVLAMLRQLVYDGVRDQIARPSWLIYSARAKEDRAFNDEIYSLFAVANGAVRITRILRDASDARKEDFEAIGRIDADLINRIFPVIGYRLKDDCDFYLSGPESFMRDLYRILRDLEVMDNRIHTELLWR